MTTLTSSVSPAASPRPADYIHYRSSSRNTRSPTINSTPSSPRPYNSTSTTKDGALAAPTPQRSPRAPSRAPYADAGTQYSPEGYPPTANSQQGAATNQGNKRKQPSPSPPMVPSADHAVITPPEPTRQESSIQTAALAQAQQEAQSEDTRSRKPRDEANAGLPKKVRVDADGTKIMPRKYETCNAKDLGVLIADMLLELIRLNDKIPLKDGKLTRFHSRAPPGISVHDYLNRLIQHATLLPPILLSMVFYIDRLCALYPAFTIGSLTVHRFLITAATVAAKGLSDSFWTNPTYARIGGISTSELATLELDFLQRIDFRIVPKPETLVDYYISLVQRSQDYRLEEEGASFEAMDEDPS